MAKNKQENKKTFLSIIARPAKGFRRAGYDFSAIKPTVIDTSKLTDEQKAQLKNEPNLVVVETGGEPAPIQTDINTAVLEAELKAVKEELPKTQGELAEAQKQLAENAKAKK